MGKYIYGIIEEEKRKEFPFSSQTPIYTIPVRKLSAVVKDAPIEVSEGSFQELISHNQILLELMASYTALPMAFGIVALDEQDIIELLTRAYHSLEEAIHRLRWKIEFNLEIRWDEKEFLKIAASEHSQIQDFRQALGSRGSALTLEDKLKLGKMAAEALEKKKTEIAEEIYHTLKKVTVAHAELPPSKNPSALFHAAFLVVQQNSDDFEKSLHALDEKFKGRLTFSLTGPLPPYTFTGIKIKIVAREEILQAQRALQLSGKVTSERLKKAYWNLSKQSHPDSRAAQTATKASNDEFKKIAQAYELLESFYKNHDYDLEGEIPQRIIIVNSFNTGETRNDRS